jgi:hypothetical protein
VNARKNGEMVTMTDGRRVTITDSPAMGNYDYAGILPDNTRIYLSETHIRTTPVNARNGGDVVALTDGRLVMITDDKPMALYDYSGILPDRTRIYISEAHIAPSILPHTITPGTV